MSYQVLFDAVPLPMFAYHSDTLRFLAVNEATVKQYGYSRDELSQMTILDIRPPEDVPHLLADMRAPWRHRRKDGTVFPVEIAASDLELDGRAARLVVVTDISARLRAQADLERSEERVRHAQKMEAVGLLAGGIAHDFNNLLSVILTYTSLLREQRFPQEVAEDIGEIHLAAERAAALTRQLLAFSRRQVMQPVSLDLGAAIAGMATLLRRLLGDDIELVVAPGTGLERVLADPSQIEQVIMNLVVNARDAMAGGGRLTLETAAVELDAAYTDPLGLAPGRYVMLAVTDTGSGMTRETQARIFEPFFTTKQMGKGTGLGLSTVFGIIKQSGGHISVYSELGQGTTFKVYLPVAPDAAETVAPTPWVGELRGSETILLAEDDDNVREAAREILGRYGYDVITARDGHEAIALAEHEGSAIDLLITDVVMPGMTGRQLAERIAAIRPETRMVFMSGHPDRAVGDHGMLDADIVYVQKPLTPEALLRKVREVLDAPPR